MVSEKVLHLIDNLNLGGAQTFFKDLRINSPAQWKFLSLNIKGHSSFGPKAKFNLWRQAYRKEIAFVKRFVEANNIKILHCHLTVSPIIGTILKQDYLPNLILIIHEHGLICNPKFKWYKSFIKRISNDADLIISVSEFTKKELIKWGIESNKIKVIYNFVNLKKIKPIKNKLTEGFTLGFLGRLEKFKGLESIFKPVRSLNLNIIVAGEGNYEKELKEKVKKLGLSKKVNFLGKINDL
jgi:glycosyltransferase involved in cell wall biosynthesis